MKASLLLPLALLTAGCAAQVEDGSLFVMQAAPGGAFAVPVSSFDERRFSGVIRQRYDFSCGSAALATLLRFHYDYDVLEDKAFRGMWEHGDRDQIRRVGFSLLDMKRWLATRGIAADGYQVTLDMIAQTGIAGIALISIKNYRHFVVVKGVRGDEILIGDPSAGLSIVSRAEFEEAWNGVYFVLSADRELARDRFDRDTQWTSYSRAPVGNTFTDPVSQQALMLTAPFYRDIS